MNLPEKKLVAGNVTSNVDDSIQTDNGESAIGNQSAKNNIDLVRRLVQTKSLPVERCDMCSLELGSDHPHLVEPATRKLICACQACAVLFSGTAEMKYRRVPKEVRYLPQFQLTDTQWASLMIPINMAFFFQSSSARKVIALYPSPGGAIESLLDFESWHEIEESNPILKSMEPDTEALLVNRVGQTVEYFIAPIDQCYHLIGVMRTKWKGFSGGTEAWEAINNFFAELKKRSKSVGGAFHA